MGIKAPAFLGDVKSFFFLRKEGSEVSTPCNAQGHPVPITRYWITHWNASTIAISLLRTCMTWNSTFTRTLFDPVVIKLFSLAMNYFISYYQIIYSGFVALDPTDISKEIFQPHSCINFTVLRWSLREIMIWKINLVCNKWCFVIFILYKIYQLVEQLLTLHSCWNYLSHDLSFIIK